MLTYTASDSGIVLCLDGEVHTIPSTDNRFHGLRKLLRQGDEVGVTIHVRPELRRVLEQLLGKCPACDRQIGPDGVHQGGIWYCSDSCAPAQPPP